MSSSELDYLKNTRGELNVRIITVCKCLFFKGAYILMNLKKNSYNTKIVWAIFYIFFVTKNKICSYYFFSLTISQLNARVASKIFTFGLHSLLICSITSGSIRLASLVKMSEEAGIQCFGPDNLAIWRVRLIVVATSGTISMVLMKESGSFEQRFYPDTKYQQVIF